MRERGGGGSGQREREIICLSFQPACPDGNSYAADRLSNTCYRLVLRPTNWILARDACEANGEMLVVLEPVVKAQFIKDFLKANRGKFSVRFKTKLVTLSIFISGVTFCADTLDEVRFVCLCLC